ncbi:HNH endonuclease domain protein [Mesorhizobium plurifarium]|uniref:HNH endonuclease domain protein n=1 Tax=Mesorhizobium plurifarium TaxID=69974 RepID=A0A0K2W437_MESPL|nr:HNH endonuclease domain protein [Mesorhizobium plurifarium]
MIHLTKVAKPQILEDNEVAWTAAIVDKLVAGEVPTNAEKTRYRNPHIKAALVTETHGKCAYCESKLLHIHHGDVEHIYPKSLDPEKTFVWNNLTLACEICNQNKSNKDPFLEHIIDPYIVEPSDHLIFSGPLVFPRGTAAGTSTRSLLDLNRGELSERRKDHLEKIMGIIDTISRADLPIATRRAIFADLRDHEAHPSAQYAAMVQTVIGQIAPSLPIDITAN